MHEPVDGDQRHSWLDKDVPPLRGRLIRGDSQTLALIALGDELEEH